MKLFFFSVSTLLFISAHSQKKTILIPSLPKIKNGLNFISKQGSISFFEIAKNGKNDGLVAKDNQGHPIPLLFSSSARINTGGKTSYAVCEVCYAITDDDGDVIDETCYEIDCSDVPSDKAVIDSISVSSYPVGLATGTYKIFQNDNIQLSAVYKKGRLINYQGKSLGNGIVFISYYTNTVLKTGVRCTIHTTDVRPDGSVREVIKTIPCDKVPSKPKPPTQ